MFYLVVCSTVASRSVICSVNAKHRLLDIRAMAANVMHGNGGQLPLLIILFTNASALRMMHPLRTLSVTNVS